jgi:hypothetical protein
MTDAIKAAAGNPSAATGVLVGSAGRVQAVSGGTANGRPADSCATEQAPIAVSTALKTSTASLIMEQHLAQ